MKKNIVSAIVKAVIALVAAAAYYYVVFSFAWPVLFAKGSAAPEGPRVVIAALIVALPLIIGEGGGLVMRVYARIRRRK